jgi:predicted unusual protein kinase regulating ubiquinone biosynthesis (AarF/ABC1/UbiB family)
MQLKQLRRYDPEAIAQYYQFRFWWPLWRSLKVAWFFAGFLLWLLIDKAFGFEENPERAEHLRRVLTDLGPTFIKVGQALSTRPDLIKPSFLEELIKLQDQLPPFSTKLAFEMMERELGRSIPEMYREISAQPVAAASLGQVYKAKLINGTPVAVKVQRPNLLPLITVDLYVMRWCASWIGPLLPLNLGHGLTLIVDEFGNKLFEEIDYLNEGRNAEKFAANFSGYEYVKVPSIYWRYCSTKVLTLEWIDGCKLTPTAMSCAGIDANALVKIAVISGLQQLLEFGFFHADPHPGNLFALPPESPDAPMGGVMAYIDFGMMDQLDQYTKETLVDAVVHLINHDYVELAHDFVNLGFLTPETDIMPIVPALEAVFKDAIGESVRDFNFKTITDRFSELVYEYPFRVPAKFALIIRSLVTQEGMALSVDPNFKIVEVAYPYVAKRLLTGETPQFRRRLLEVLFRDGKFAWDRLENMLNIARSEGSFDLLPTAQMGFQFLMSEEGQYLRKQLLLALVEDDRFHTEEVQRLWNLVKNEVQPAQLWTTAFGFLAEFSRDQMSGWFGSGEARKEGTGSLGDSLGGPLGGDRIAPPSRNSSAA